MCKVYGYARVSTLRQKLERQIDNIKAAYPDAVIISEKYTGTQTDRPELNKLLKSVHEGDTIVFDSVSRMSRTAEDGFTLYMDLYNKGINLFFLKEPMIDTDVYKQTVQLVMTGTDADVILEGVNKYLKKLAEKQIKIAFDQAEKEVQDLHKRISEGLWQAKIRGSQVGRETGRTYESKKSKDMKIKIAKMSRDFDGSMKDKDIMEILHLSRNTYYKYKSQLIQSQE